MSLNNQEVIHLKSKPVVRYVGLYSEVVLGDSVTLFAIDHPSLGPTKAVYTSAVVSYDADNGTIETRNTVYVLAE